MKNIEKIIIFALALVAVIAVVWGGTVNSAKADITNSLENSYSRSFYDLINSAENLVSLTTKTKAINSNEQAILACSDIIKYANFASATLATLPLDQSTITEIWNFLNQLSDYSQVKLQTLAGGIDLTDAEREQFALFSDQTTELSEYLRQLFNTMNENGMFFTAENIDNSDLELSIGSTFTDMNAAFSNYPTLIYDGPFSDHMESSEALGITGSAVSSDEAISRAKEILSIWGKEDYTIEFVNETAGDIAISVYCIEASGNNELIHFDFSKTGNNLVLLSNSRSVNDTSLTEEEAIAKASEFLVALGYETMTSTYVTTYDNTMTIAFVLVEGDVLIYADQIKISVALDDGEIIGLSAGQYFMHHTERDYGTPTLSVSEAEEYVTTALDIESRQITLIPKDNGSEVLCYEFRGTIGDDTFIIYINANTGAEEDILQVIEDDNGKFTM